MNLFTVLRKQGKESICFCYVFSEVLEIRNDTQNMHSNFNLQGMLFSSMNEWSACYFQSLKICCNERKVLFANINAALRSCGMH